MRTTVWDALAKAIVVSAIAYVIFTFVYSTINNLTAVVSSVVK